MMNSQTSSITTSTSPTLVDSSPTMSFMQSKSAFPPSTYRALPSTSGDCSGHPLRRPGSVQSLHSALSYLSTSTMTMSDLPGPGRLIDKYIYTRGGRALERLIARAAHSLGFGPLAAALRVGANLKGFSLQDCPSSEALISSDVVTQRTLRLELGLVRDVRRIDADCHKLVRYAKTNTAATRIQALTMIITLYIRFPYLSSYIDSAGLSKDAQSIRSFLNLPKDDGLEDCLSRMALACLAPMDDANSVARLVDHLAERTKVAEENPKPQSSGPWYPLLPDTVMIRKYCENPKTSFASLRLTTIIFRHSFLSRADEYYVKLNDATVPSFWRDLLECIRHLVRTELARPCQCSCLRHNLAERHLGRMGGRHGAPSTEADLEGIDLFAEAIYEMLYRALAWDPLLRKMWQRFFFATMCNVVTEAVELFESPLAQMLFPDTSYIALAKIKPQLEVVRAADVIRADLHFVEPHS